MNWLRRLRLRLEVVLRKRSVEEELDEEIRYHLEREIAENERAGMNPLEARRRAVWNFGGVERVKEEVRDARGARWMDDFLMDLRFGARRLWKEKGLSATVLMTLALCIGVNATLFAVVNPVLLQPLPYEEPDRLVTVFNSYPNAGNARSANSGPDCFFRREQVGSLEEVACFLRSVMAVGDPAETQRARVLQVSSTFLAVLKVTPILGRDFLWEEMEPGKHQKAILTYAFWQGQYGGDESVLGKDVRIEGEPHTIVGVLPESFRMLGENAPRQLLVPLRFTPEQRSIASLHGNQYEQVARLAPGATLELARAQIATLNERLVDPFMESAGLPNGRQLLEETGFHTVVRPTKADIVRNVRQSLILLWAGVAFVLLIGCVNIASLMLVRATGRLREHGIRVALGAGRGRLARQLVTEALLLGLLGSGFGLVVAYVGTQSLSAFGLQGLPRGGAISVDATVAAITLLLGVGASIVFGGIPLFSILRNDLVGVFQAAGRTATASRKSAGLRNVLVVAQVAMAFVLLLGAGLLLRSFQNVQSVDSGFRPDGVLAGSIVLPDTRYPDDISKRQFAQELLAEIRSLPGVQLASVTTQLPFSGFRSSGHVVPENRELPAGESVVNSFKNWVGTDYFETLGIPLLEGRTFVEADVIDGRRVIVLDDWLADRYFPDESAVGKVMLFGALPGMEVEDWEPFRFTVVGVVGSIKQNNLVDSSRGAFYLPFARELRPRLTLLMKSGTDLTPLVQASGATISDIDPELPFFAVRPMQTRIDGSVMGFRSNMLVMMLFSGIALFMASVGIYGILAHSVTMRRKEMGIRMALGSHSGNLVRVVVGHGLKLVVLGLILGAAGFLVLARLIRSLLFGVQPSDPGIAVLGAAVLTATALLACLVPALRASRIDPVLALRADLE